MGRVIGVIVGLLLVLALAGFAMLGAFPPAAKPEQVQRVLPNERFIGR